MNTILHTYTSYLRPSRSIETIVLDNGRRRKVVFVYNYEGQHFRVFDEVQGLLAFFEGAHDAVVDFHDEESLDRFLTYDYVVKD